MCRAALAFALAGVPAAGLAAPCPPVAEALRAVERARTTGDAAGLDAWRDLGGAITWHVVGPLPGASDRRPPAVDDAMRGRFDGSWPGVEGRVTWRTEPGPVARVPPAERGVHVLTTTLPATPTPRAVLRFGSSVVHAVWVDGELVAAGRGQPLAYDAMEVALSDSVAPRRLVALVEGGAEGGGFLARAPQAGACPPALPPPGVPAWIPAPVVVAAAPPGALARSGSGTAEVAAWWIAPGPPGRIVLGWRAGRPTTATALAALPHAGVDADAPGDLRLELPEVEGWPLEPLPLDLPCPGPGLDDALDLGPPTVARAQVDWAGPRPPSSYLGGPFGLYRRTVQRTAAGWVVRRELHRTASRVEPAALGAYRRWCRAVRAAASERVPPRE